MLKVLKTSIFLLAIFVLPGMAMATHMTSVSVNGDCEGWTATVDVHYRSSVYEAAFDFVIILLNAEGQELERFEHGSVISRQPGDGPDAVYNFGGSWEGYFQSSFFVMQGNFHIYAPWGYGGVYLDEESKEAELQLECTVPTEDVTWDRVKTLYR